MTRVLVITLVFLLSVMILGVRRSRGALLEHLLFLLLWILSDKRLPVLGLCSKPKLPFDVTIPLYLLQSMVVIIVIKDFYRNTFGAGGTQIHSHYQILLGKIVCTFGPPALIFFFC